MKRTVLMKYVKLGWRMRGEANGTKSNQKSIEPNRSDCYSIGSIIELELQPWSKRLGTLEEIRHKDALCFYLLKTLIGGVVIRRYFCCSPLPQAVLIVLN